MGEILAKLAPTAAALIGGPLGGLAVEALGSALGLSNATQDSIKEVISSGSMTPEQVAAIKQAEINLKDRASARSLLVDTRSIIPAALSIITVGGFFALLIGSATGHFTLTGSDVMMLLLGVLARETASVYQFWLGSSSGSQQKTELMGKK
jgi:hypothetical protein